MDIQVESPPSRGAASLCGHTRGTREPTCIPRRRWSIPPGERRDVGTGIALAIPEGFAGFVQPRSGLAFRHGITIVNAPGLIDAGYRGEVRVCLLNTGARALRRGARATASRSW